MQNTIDQAKRLFLVASGQLRHALETTSDDQLNWSPSPTARTPIQIAAHAAGAIESLRQTMEGEGKAIPKTDLADRAFRRWERQYSTRERVLEMLDQYGSSYMEWLDSLTSSDLSRQVTFPYRPEPVSMVDALTYIPFHTSAHAAQIVYIQTIYGDRDWHVED